MRAARSQLVMMRIWQVGLLNTSLMRAFLANREPIVKANHTANRNGCTAQMPCRNRDANRRTERRTDYETRRMQASSGTNAFISLTA